MDSLFHDSTSFNGDISSWDVSDVTSMISLFNNANEFNGRHQQMGCEQRNFWEFLVCLTKT